MILGSGDYVCNDSTKAKMVIGLTIPKLERPEKSIDSTVSRRSKEK